jgi:hypothetical protein
MGRRRGTVSREGQQPGQKPRVGRILAAGALEVLNVAEGAAGQEIRAAYKRLRQHLHTDKDGS